MGSNSDWERGKDAIYKNRDRIHAGYEAHENRTDFDAGWDLGRRASDPNDRDWGAQEVVGTVRKEYGGRAGSARDAYRDGFAAGASRVQKVDDEY